MLRALKAIAFRSRQGCSHGCLVEVQIIHHSRPQRQPIPLEGVHTPSHNLRPCPRPRPFVRYEHQAPCRYVMWHSFSTTFDAFLSAIHSTCVDRLRRAIAAATIPCWVAALRTLVRARDHESGSDGSTRRSVNDLRYRLLNRSIAPSSIGRSHACSIAAATSFRTSSTFGFAMFVPPERNNARVAQNEQVVRLFALARAVVDQSEARTTMKTPPIATVRPLHVHRSDPNAAGARRFDEPIVSSSSTSEDGDVDLLDGAPAPADAFPSRAVVHIISNRGTCTGWLFGPDLVVTAGHCVNAGGQPGNDHAWADLDSVWVSTRVAEGETGLVPLGVSSRARRLRASDGWIQSAADDQDFGAIKLADSRLGERLGWLGIERSPEVEPGTPIRLTGFMKTDCIDPCVNFGGEHPTYAKCMWRSRVAGTRDGRLLFDADTHPGDSGSPILSAKCAACAVAILTGRSPEAAATNTLARQAALISRRTFDTLIAWRDSAA